MGFNCVRLPFSLWMTEQSHPVPNQYLAANPDLYGKTPMEVYDACVRALTGAGLIVIPNCHLLDYGWCCSTGDENGLWFNDRWPASKFTQVVAGHRQALRLEPAGRRDGHQERAARGDGRREGAQPDLGDRRADRHRRHVHDRREPHPRDQRRDR